MNNQEPKLKGKIVLKKNTTINKIWHPESTLVFKSSKEKLVIGRFHDNDFVPLDDEALDLFVNHRTPKLKYLLLSHLSKENNDPDLVKKLFELNTTNTEIIIASRNAPSLIYEVIHPSIKKTKIKTNIKQLSLFD